MSSRGGKRRQVLQMGSASKLHRYGYSKEFQSRDKKGKDTITSLVGEFSDTDSDENRDVEESNAGDARNEGENLTSGLPAPSGDLTFISASSDMPDGSVMPEKPSDMDDELKHFLSEIEAIPMPTNGSDQEAPVDPDINLGDHSEAGQDVQKPVAKTKLNNHYSMFVKGESEFVHSPKAAENSHVEPKEEDFPDEPLTNWQMVQDENTQYYYYWNTVTNEVTWEIPSDYTQFLLLHREYEEKIAKYSPEQREKLKEKHTKTATKDAGVESFTSDAPTSAMELNPSDALILTSATTQGPDRRFHKSIVDSQYGQDSAREMSPTKSLSPHPESSQESRHHKHKKEKRSHHKKKHRKKHDDQHSDEEKHSPKASENSQLQSSIQTSAVSGCKLLSIVPYLSDQDDSDEEEKSDPVSRPEPATSLVTDPRVEKESVHEGESLESRLSPVSVDVTNNHLQMNEASQPALLLQKQDEAYLTSLLLLPPPPPPPPQEEEPTREQISEDISDTKKNMLQNTDKTLTNPCQDLSESNWTNASKNLINCNTAALFNNSTAAHFDDKEVNEMISAIVDPIKISQLTENESNVLFDTKQDSNTEESHAVKDTQNAKPIIKEVIDMFAEHFPMQNLPQGKEETLEVKGSVNTDIHGKETVKAMEQPEEVMEDGEILEVSEREAPLQKEKHIISGKSWQSISEMTRSEAGEQKMLKSVNIVGYASDDEEEEGEVREKVVKKENKQPLYNEKRKKDRKRESKKHRKDTETGLSMLVDSKLDKKVVSTTLGLPSQVNVSHEVLEVKKPEKKLQEDDDDVDLEFDVDDIDRALDVALEKKMDKKKVELQVKVSNKENSIKEEVINTTESSDVTEVHLVSDVAICQTKNLENEETSADKDSSHIKKPLQDCVNKTETDEANHVAEIKVMAELALNKLEFLDISTDNLSRLQVLFIELQTRHTDWMAGGLSTQYFYDQLKIAEGLLEQYELSAVPDGWACQWDRANNRYYYRNTVTNRIQWEYPDGQNKEKEEPQVIEDSKDESVIKVRARGSDERRRSRGSGSGSVRSRKKDDKDKSKHDRRNSSRHYHRKRRRGRDQSNSSNSSVDSQQHRRHRKSKKKKKHRVERSPSVEIVECIDRVDVDEIEDIPNNPHQPNTPSQPAPMDSPNTMIPPVGQDELTLAPEELPSQHLMEDSATDMLMNLEAAGEDIAGSSTTEEEAATVTVNPVIISKPPQINIHPSMTAGLNTISKKLSTKDEDIDQLDGYPPSEMYPNPQIITSAPVSFYPSYAIAQPNTDVVLPFAEMVTDSSETLETDKTTKKKKKEKKSLTTGSSIMMKKKHMSSMVQKWQKVKIEVEKEDRAKELRQAAIRRKIEELKSSDKQPS